MYVPPHRRGLQSSGEPSSSGAAQGCSNDGFPKPRPSDGRHLATGRGGNEVHENKHAGERSSRPRFGRGRNGRPSQPSTPGGRVARGEQTTNSDDSHEVSNPAPVILLCDRLCGIKCINMNSRRDQWEQVQRQARRIGLPFAQKLERFEAIDGGKVLRAVQQVGPNAAQAGEVVQIEWDATRNARYSSRVTASVKRMTAGEVGCAASHVQLWRNLVDAPDLSDDNAAWLVLEDDCAFAGSSGGRRGQSSQPRFAQAFHLAWNQLPEDWDLLYLGFSSRGERTYVELKKDSEAGGDDSRSADLHVQLYRPTYGFHTHAYVVKRRTARFLLERLPVVGPIDVWMADNAWWGLDVFCAVIANEGWQREDGTFEGSNLVSQQKGKYSSDVPQSSDAK